MEPKSHKEKQLEIVQKANPMTDDYHTGIRSVDDIKTFQEALDDEGYDGGSLTPDYGEDKVEKAKETGVITVYSSKPIENGNFVTPSKMEAESYAGSGQVYSKEVKLEDVAWIDPLQGQYAKPESVSDRIRRQREKSQEPQGTKTLDNPEDYKKGTFDKETKTYTTPNGHKVSMIGKKDYDKLCQRQREDSSEDTLKNISSYTQSQAHAYSSELNSATPENLARGYGNRYRICDNESLVCTQREYEEICEKMWESWIKEYNGSQSGRRENGEDYEEFHLKEREWQKQWGVTESPARFAPDTYHPRYHWTKEEVEEGKAIYKALSEAESRYNRVEARMGYDHGYWEEFMKECREIRQSAKSERLRALEWSSWGFKDIAEYDTEKRYRPEVQVVGNPDIKEMNIKEILDTDWDESTLAKQPSQILKTINSVKSSVKSFDEAFEKDGITLDHDILVFRRSHESNQNIDEGFTRSGYTSCTVKDTLPKKMPSGLRFGDQEYYIVVPAGTKMLFAEKVIGYERETRADYEESGYKKADEGIKRQHEVILPRNAHFTKLEWDPSTGAYIMRVDWEKGEKKHE